MWQKKVSVNGLKRKLMKARDGQHRDMTITLGRLELLKEVSSFVYLGVVLRGVQRRR